MSSVKVKKHQKSLADAEKQVQKILKKMKEFGIDKKDLKMTIKKGQNAIHLKRILLGTAVLLVILFMIASILMNDSDCWVPLPDFIQASARPPVNCGMCRDISEVKRFANLTADEFERKFAYSGTPIIITDATTNWTAQSVFSFEFFKGLYLNEDHTGAFDRCSFFPYKTEFKSLEDALLMDEDRSNLANGTKPWYIGWSNCQESTAKILRKHYTKPYFLPKSSDNLVLDWIFMGGPGDGAHMHVDNVVYPSWQAQLKGRKEWDLAPPPECFYECISLTAVVNPGEVIVLDTNRWFHRTRVVSKEISITIGAEYD